MTEGIHFFIKTRRKELGMSLAALARKITELERAAGKRKTDLSYQVIQHWEAGRAAPARTRLPFVLKALDAGQYVPSYGSPAPPPKGFRGAPKVPDDVANAWFLLTEDQAKKFKHEIIAQASQNRAVSEEIIAKLQRAVRSTPRLPKKETKKHHSH